MYLPSCTLKSPDADCRLLPDGRERTASAADFPCVAGSDLYQANACSLHWHDEFEIVVVSSGVLSAAVNGSEYTIAAGEGIFVNTGVLHAYKETTGARADVLYLLFLPALIGGTSGSVFWTKYLEPLVSSLRLSALALRGEDWHRDILACAHSAAALLREEPPGFEIEVRSLLSHITQTICGNAVPAGPESGRQSEAAQAMRQMLAFLDDNCAREIRVAEIAASAHISVRSCQRLFQRFTSRSPKQFLLSLRLEKAQKLLRETAWSIPDIAAVCGFSDQSYFTKLFRRRFGSPPAAYRKGSIPQ